MHGYKEPVYLIIWESNVQYSLQLDDHPIRWKNYLSSPLLCSESKGHPWASLLHICSYLFIDDSCIHLYDKLCSSCNHFTPLFSTKLMFSTVLLLKNFSTRSLFSPLGFMSVLIKWSSIFCLYVRALPWSQSINQ